MLIDGNTIGSVAMASAIYASTAPLSIGNRREGLGLSGGNLKGWMKNLIITKG